MGIFFGWFLGDAELKEMRAKCVKKLASETNEAKIENLVEEIADVLIMIEQLKIMYKVTDEQIDEAVTMKLLRLFEKLDKEGYIDDKYDEVEE